MASDQAVVAPALPTPRRSALRVRLRNLEPITLLWLVLAGALLVLVAFPLGKLLLASLETPDGVFTLQNYADAYGRARYIDALVNSLKLGALSAGIAMVLAVPMAWGVSRTDMPGKGFAWAMVMAAFVMPPYLGAVGWICWPGRIPVSSTCCGMA